MVCKNPSKKANTSKNEITIKENLNEKGRLQFFYHSPSSEFPIRDVPNDRCHGGNKTEPHIEIGAENYLDSCYQKNIRQFIKNDEKYLFLMTTCRNKNLQEFYGKRFIVGYILMKCYGENIKDIFYIKGDTYLYLFDDAIPITDLGYSEFPRVGLVNESDTEKILNHFGNRKNIIKDCIEEIKRIDKDNKTCYKKIGMECIFETECLRWKSN